MKRKAIAVITILTFVLSTLAGQSVSLAKANWLIPTSSSPPPKPEISILLPEPDKTYSTTVGVDFLVVGPGWADLRNYIKLSSISYSIDDSPAVQFIREQIVVDSNNGFSRNLVFHFLGNITELSHGTHSIVVYAEFEGKYSPEPYRLEDFKAAGASSKTYFTVNSSITDTILPENTILTPANEVYNTIDIAISLADDEPCSQVRHSLDGEKSVATDGNTTLTGLSDGPHILLLFASDLAGNTKSSVTSFTVSAPPIILIVSPENKIYETTNTTLDFTVNDPVLWIKYSLDNKANQTATGNITLTDLTDGQHTIVVYACDTSEKVGASETVAFTVGTLEEPFPTVPIAAASIAVIIVASGLLIYWKKRNRDVKIPSELDSG